MLFGDDEEALAALRRVAVNASAIRRETPRVAGSVDGRLPSLERGRGLRGLKSVTGPPVTLGDSNGGRAATRNRRMSRYGKSGGWVDADLRGGWAIMDPFAAVRPMRSKGVGRYGGRAVYLTRARCLDATMKAPPLPGEVHVPAFLLTRTPYWARYHHALLCYARLLQVSNSYQL